VVTRLIAYLLVGGAAVYLAVCAAAFVGLLRRRGRRSDALPTVSVIIAARNEERNIGAVLDDLLAQTYPADRFDIIVVDDCSEDGTAAVAGEYAARCGRISLRETVSSKSPYSHKKKAVHEGIMGSDGEIVMTVDADCRVPRNWIEDMVSYFLPGVDLVAGEILVEGGGLMGWLESLEFTGIQMMSAGLMNAGFPMTCNGANLAYRRSAFERVGGYDGIGRVVSGDDDMLMQKISRDDPTTVVYVTGIATAVRVEAKHTLREFIVQRTRWASKIATYPSRKAVALLAVFFLFFTAVVGWAGAALIGLVSWKPLAAAFAMKVAGDLLMCGYGELRNGRSGLLLLMPLAELVHVPYILFVTVRGYFGAFEWRGRRVRAVDGDLETVSDGNLAENAEKALP